MSVGQASGLALAEAASVGCEVVQYTPNQVKEAVVGYGAATKAQVQRLVQARLDLAAPPSPPDAADAAALALCHLAWAPWRARLERRMIGSLPGVTRGTLLERSPDGEVLVEVAASGYRVVGHAAHARPRGRSRRRGVPLRPRPRPRGRAHAVRLPRAATSGRASRRCSARTASALRSRWRSWRCTRRSTSAAPSRADDADALCLVPGVGKKTAARLLIDLKTRLDGARSSTSACAAAARRREHASADPSSPTSADALTGLGYGTDEVRDAMRDLEDGTMTRLRCSAKRCSASRRCAAMREELLEPAPDPGGARARGQPAASLARRVRRPERAEGSPRHHPRGRSPPRPGR